MAALRTFVAASLPALLAALPVSADPTLDSLLRSFAAMPAMSARFVEEKRIALLRAPLVTEGAIYYQAPDRIARHVERPAPSTLSVHGGMLAIFDASGVRTLDLDAAPIAGAFVETLRLVLAGNLEALRASHGIRFQAKPGNSSQWVLELVPRGAPLLDVIARIEIAGERGEISHLRIVEADGDETDTRFSDVDVARRFDAAELARLFPAAAQ